MHKQLLDKVTTPEDEIHRTLHNSLSPRLVEALSHDIFKVDREIYFEELRTMETYHRGGLSKDPP